MAKVLNGDSPPFHAGVSGAGSNEPWNARARRALEAFIARTLEAKRPEPGDVCDAEQEVGFVMDACGAALSVRSHEGEEKRPS